MLYHYIYYSCLAGIGIVTALTAKVREFLEDRQRETERDRQTDRDRQILTETESLTDRDTNRESERATLIESCHVIVAPNSNNPVHVHTT